MVDDTRPDDYGAEVPIPEPKMKEFHQVDSNTQDLIERFCIEIEECSTASDVESLLQTL
jgi:hypothetical protein